MVSQSWRGSVRAELALTPDCAHSDFLLKFIVIGMLYTLKRGLEAQRCICAGEAGTGKSCLLHYFMHNSCAFRAALHMWRHR